MATKRSHGLEQELSELLDEERFEPPEEFRRGRSQRPRHLRGGRQGSRGAGGCARRPSCSTGSRSRRGARRLRSSVLQVVRRRQAERLGQLPRPPRRGRQRRPGRLPLARGGGRGARCHLRRPARRRPAIRQRAARSRNRQGRRGRDLPADDPAGRRRDAGLRPDRRDPQRRLRGLLGRGRARADGILRGEGAGHRRRRPPQGQDGPGQGRSRRPDRRGRLDRDGLVVRHTGAECEMQEGRDIWFDEAMAAAEAECPAEPMAAEDPLLHPLHLGLDREAEGHPPHHRRLPDRRRLDPPLRLRPASPRRTSTGARPTSAGSPATPTSSTGRSPTARPA